MALTMLPERSARAVNGDRNHGQNDAVLGHRLPILALAKRSEHVEELQHLIHLLPPSQACLAARQGTTTGERGEWKSRVVRGA